MSKYSCEKNECLILPFLFASFIQGSVGSENYMLLKNYVADSLIPQVFPANPNTRLGALGFSTGIDPNYSILSSPDGSREDLRNAIRNDDYSAGQTFTRQALEHAITTLTALDAEGRQARKFVILFTDGTPSPLSQNVCVCGSDSFLRVAPSVDLGLIDRVFDNLCRPERNHERRRRRNLWRGARQHHSTAGESV